MMESIAQQAAKDARDVFSDDRQAQTASAGRLRRWSPPSSPRTPRCGPSGMWRSKWHVTRLGGVVKPRPAPSGWKRRFNGAADRLISTRAALPAKAG